MKKYYCPKCKAFKYRCQLKKVDDTRGAWLACRWCHSSNIYTTEDVLQKLITNSDLDLDDKHGSFL